MVFSSYLRFIAYFFCCLNCRAWSTLGSFMRHSLINFYASSYFGYFFGWLDNLVLLSRKLFIMGSLSSFLPSFLPAFGLD